MWFVLPPIITFSYEQFSIMFSDPPIIELASDSQQMQLNCPPIIVENQEPVGPPDIRLQNPPIIALSSEHNILFRAPPRITESSLVAKVFDLP